MTYLPLRVRAKLFIKKFLPVSVFIFIQSVWRKTFSKIIDQTKTIDAYTRDFIAKNGLIVAGGPFAGLNYVGEAAGSNYLTKLIGVYEEILHPIMETAKQRNYDTIIDIGCAEGYYLIGLGRSLPSAHLIGYDIDQKALALTKKLYELNHLPNKLTLIGDCTPSDLDSSIDDNTLLICDAEGFEYTALDATSTPTLKNVRTFIVELHDFAVPGIKKILTDRFEKTHEVHVVKFKNGDASKYPYLMTIRNQSHLYTLLRERGEQEQEWLILEKKC